MAQINTLVLPNQPRFEVYKDANSGVVIRVNNDAVRLSPHEASDLAVVLFRLAGIEVILPPKRNDDLGGKDLKAKVKMVF